jgi:hypothetical protein
MTFDLPPDRVATQDWAGSHSILRGSPSKELTQIPQQKRRRAFTSWHTFSADHWLHLGSKRSTYDPRFVF